MTIRTIDTNVVVLAVATFSKIAPTKMWIAFGVESRYRCLPLHEMVAKMNPTQCFTLPDFMPFLAMILYLLLLAEGKILP